MSGVIESAAPAMAVKATVVSGYRNGSDMNGPFLLVGVGDDSHQTGGGVDETSLR